MSRSQRLLELLQVMRRHRRPVTAAALAAELGVSVRTVYRDVATLVAQGAPFEGEAGMGYVLKPGFLLPPLMFSEGEIEALVLGLRFVAQRGDADLVRDAADALAKIAAVLPRDKREAAAEAPVLAGSEAGTAEGPVALPVLREAIRGQRKLRLHYVDGEGRETARVVWPFALAFFDRVRVLAAWCETRGDFRHFRTDRITAAAVLGERYPARRATLTARWREREGIPQQLPGL